MTKIFICLAVIIVALSPLSILGASLWCITMGYGVAAVWFGILGFVFQAGCLLSAFDILENLTKCECPEESATDPVPSAPLK